MRPLAFFERIYMSQTREGIRVALDRKKYLSLSQDEAEAIDQEILKLIKESTGNIKALIGSVIKIDGGYTLGGEKVQPMPKRIL